MFVCVAALVHARLEALLSLMPMELVSTMIEDKVLLGINLGDPWVNLLEVKKMGEHCLLI